MSQIFLGTSSGTVPELIPGLQSRFSRNPQSFPVNRYIQRFPSIDRDGRPVTRGIYTRIPPNFSFTLDSIEANWPEHSNRPVGRPSVTEYANFITQRSSFNVDIPERAINSGGYISSSLVENLTQEKLELAMVQKTAQVERALTTLIPGRFTDFSTAVGATANSASIDDATPANRYLKRAIDAGVEAIQRAVMGAVSRDQIGVIMSQDVASAISQSQEYLEIVAGSPFSADFIRGDGFINTNTNLVPKLYGVTPIVHQDGIAIGDPSSTTPPTPRRFYTGLGTQTVSAATVQVHSVMAFVVLPDKLTPGPLNDGDPRLSVNGVAGIRSATVVDIYAEDMTVDYELKRFDRMHQLGVTNDYTIHIANPIALHVLTNVLDQD